MRRFTISLVAVALVAAACSSPESEAVVTVDGRVISVGDVASLFSYETSDLYSDDAIPIDAGFRTAAFRLLALDVLERAYEQEFGTTVDETEADELYQSFLADIAAQGATVEDVVGIAYASESMIEFDARLTLIRDGVIAELAKDPVLVEALQASLTADPAAMTTVCVRHILLPTEEAAQAALTRLEAAEDFAAVATELSLDSTPEGDLGCAAPGTYVAEFADASMTAEIGVLHGPVETNFGFHVLIVDDRFIPTAEDLAADPGAYLPTDQLQALWIDWINTRLAAADVEVNEKFGAWDPAALRIVAPPASE